MSVVSDGGVKGDGVTATMIRTEGPSSLPPGPRSIAAAPSPQVSRSTRRLTHTTALFAVDVALTVAIVAVIEVPLTGLAVHEWLGIALAVGCGLHLVQHAAWLNTTGRRFFARCSFKNRLNYLMMAGLFVGFSTIIASGLLISESALPAVGLTPPGGDFWRWLHLASVLWVLWLTAAHLAFNRDWIVKTVRRHVLGRVGSQRTLEETS